MLISNNSTVDFIVTIKLVFDDDTEKIKTISIGDIVTVTYREDGNKITRTGKITNLKPVITNSNILETKTDVLIYMDSSNSFMSDTAMFKVSDILDFENDEIEPEQPSEQDPTDTEPEQPSEQDKEDSGQIEIDEDNTESLE